MLERRVETILRLIVEAYLKESTPVSSDSIASELGYTLSPATIRNTMAKLEKEGFLFQPYISSGRIPTDKALKFYVESILEEMNPFQEVEKIMTSNEPSEIYTLLERASKFLSDSSDCMSFILVPPIEFIPFTYINFEKISSDAILLTLLSSSNLIVTKVFKNTEGFTQEELSNLSQFLQEKFAGQNINSIKITLLREISNERMNFARLLEKFINFFNKIEEEREEKIDVRIHGYENLLGKLEFPDLEALKKLLKSLEEKSNLLNLLRNVSAQGTKVLFGSEIESFPLPSFSFVISGLKTGDMTMGSVGIIGSKRMFYKVTIPLVEGTAKFLSNVLF